MDIKQIAEQCREVLRDCDGFVGIDIWDDSIQFQHRACSDRGYSAYDIKFDVEGNIVAGLSGMGDIEYNIEGVSVDEWCMYIWNSFIEHFLDDKLFMFRQFAKYGTN